MGGGSDLDRNPGPGPGQGPRPWVEVRRPDGGTEAVELDNDLLRVGREPGWSDLDLAQADRRWISRRHFRIERCDNHWTVVDEGSRNGTFLRRAGALVRVEAASRLDSGDTVAVLARMDGAEPVYWELIFHDPELTEPAPQNHRAAPAVDYDWVEGRAFVVRPATDGRDRVEVVGLRPQEHRLIRHLVARNTEAGVAVLCPYSELIAAVWGDEPHAPHTREELARVVYELRQKLEPDPAHPELLRTVRGFGYRLATVGSA